MHFVGFDLSHNRVLGRTGLALSGGHNRSTGYHQNGDNRRYHLYAKAVHRFSPTSYWRVMGNWALDDHGVFIQWRDRNHPLAVPENDAPAPYYLVEAASKFRVLSAGTQRVRLST